MTGIYATVWLHDWDLRQCGCMTGIYATVWLHDWDLRHSVAA